MGKVSLLWVKYTYIIGKVYYELCYHFLMFWDL